MEDVKWLLRRCGLPILLLLIFVIAGVVCWGELHTEKQKVAEEVWEPPVEIENSEAETEEAENAETSTESAYWFIPQASDDLLTEEEKEQLQSTVLSAAESVREIYKDIVIADALSYSSGISEFTKEQRKAVVEQLGRNGLVSVEEDTAMQNHEAIEAFYADYLDGQDSMVTVFEVQRDGLIGAVTFIYRKGELQTYYIGIRWREGGMPEIQGTSVSNVAEIKLTEKGYFIYAYEYVIAHASLRQYWRTEPLPLPLSFLPYAAVPNRSFLLLPQSAISKSESHISSTAILHLPLFASVQFFPFLRCQTWCMPCFLTIILGRYNSVGNILYPTVLQRTDHNLVGIYL